MKLFALALTLLLVTAGAHPQTSRRPTNIPTPPASALQTTRFQPAERYDPRSVRLKSRVFVPATGVDGKLRSYVERQRREGHAHVLVQFQEPPGQRERRLLEDSFKSRLLDPVPERAYFVGVPADLDVLRRLSDRGGPARAVALIEPEDKISPLLRLVGVPEYARRKGGAAELIVEFFGDVESKRQEEVLHEADAKAVARIVGLNGWRVLLDPKGIRRLAEQDEVKWVEEIPPPPTDDNDGVRSASGVNSDAVLPPTPYNLTGAGVVVAQWEWFHASLTHGDFGGRITVGDGAIPTSERSQAHTERIAANDRFDNGEGVYRDMDDSASVSVGDVRETADGGADGTIVAAGDSDVGAALVLFYVLERFNDADDDGQLDAGEGVYVNNNSAGTVSVGDTRLTPVGAFAAGSTVAEGDADIDRQIKFFLTNPHEHATHVAGTAIGSGARSEENGGGPNQWKGVAPGASLRSYDVPDFDVEYVDAAANNVAISTNSWGNTHCHQVVPPLTCYSANSELYDAIISGRRSDGRPSGMARRISIFGSAGNEGRPERHAENVTADALFEVGETIYKDEDDDGLVSEDDIRVTGLAQANGTPLVNFALDEMHTDRINDDRGTFQTAEAIYRDADRSRTVTAGDTRVTATSGFTAGSVVAIGNSDIGANLRQFRLWGNVRLPNSAKDTVEVASVNSDTNSLSMFSSRGPTDDGRVKPDLAGPGSRNGGFVGITSTIPYDRYGVIHGTSMSTPAVSGVAALLTEWYKRACVAEGPTPAALKAILLHGAEDLTNIPNVGTDFVGPDFAFGYGRARAKESVDLVPHHRLGVVNEVGDTDFTVTVGRMQTLKVTLAWDDPSWTADAAPSAATGILQNDLDLTLIAPDGTRHTPWVLRADAPNEPATRASFAAGAVIPDSARDRRNTVEQVSVADAMPGTWRIRVTASTLRLPAQDFVIVSEALPPQTGACAGAPAADVWMRDNASDNGAQPSSGRMYRSPDLWNRRAPDDATTHQNPEFRQQNYIYANIRNNLARTSAAKAVSIDFWLAPASTGLTWPDDFRYVGRISVPNLRPGEVRQVGPLAWMPPSPEPSDHFCFYVRVVSPQDAFTFAETEDVSANASGSNNLVWRNVNVVDILSSRSVTFLARNTARKAAPVDLTFEIPEKFLRDGEVYLRLSPELERRWPAQYRKVEGLAPSNKYGGGQPERAGGKEKQGELSTKPYRITGPVVVLRGIVLEPRQAEPLTLTFNSARKEKNEYEVNVVQQAEGKVVGGIVYFVRTGRKKDGDDK